MASRNVVFRVVQDESDQAVITVAVDIDRVLVHRLRHHLQGAIRAGARFIILDLSGVRRCDPLVLDLLTWAQHQLVPRRGMITVVGLRADALAGDPDAPEYVSACDSAPDYDRGVTALLV